MSNIKVHFSSETNEWATKFKNKIFIKNNCFIFTGCKDKDGYGACSYKGKQIRAHRLSFVLSKKELPEHLCVGHTCDTPACINPNHLFLCTNQENTMDRTIKNRSAKGEKSGTAKLTDNLVREIRSKFIPRKYSIRMLAKEYGVCYATIRELLILKNWKHVK